MAEKSDVNAKWDACLDLSVRRFVYSSLAGAFAGLLLFRTPVTRRASIAFGAGVGIGSAYADCSRIFDGSAAKLVPPKTTSSAPEELQPPNSLSTPSQDGPGLRTDI
uniref:MICOS complex subunit MIC10 n=1 Tax=Salix viminalis TaxID=40686 RepID=A0A6N2MAG7_SALVM